MPDAEYDCGVNLFIIDVKVGRGIDTIALIVDSLVGNETGVDAVLGIGRSLNCLSSHPVNVNAVKKINIEVNKCGIVLV